MTNIIKFRRDILENYQQYNPVLHDGEFAYIINSKEIIVGDGINRFNEIQDTNIIMKIGDGIITDGLALEYDFRKEVKDRIGTRNPVVINNPPYYCNDKVGWYSWFNGSNQYVNISNLGLRDIFNSNFSIFAIAYCSGDADSEIWSFSKDQIRCNIQNSSTILFDWCKWQDYKYTVPKTLYSRWFPIVYIIDRSNYRQGFCIDGYFYGWYNNPMESISTDIGYIAGETSAYDNHIRDFFYGGIGLFRVYNRALTINEAKILCSLVKT